MSLLNVHQTASSNVTNMLTSYLMPLFNIVLRLGQQTIVLVSLGRWGDVLTKFVPPKDIHDFMLASQSENIFYMTHVHDTWHMTHVVVVASLSFVLLFSLFGFFSFLLISSIGFFSSDFQWTKLPDLSRKREEGTFRKTLARVLNITFKMFFIFLIWPT